ncbi:hypothetical protein CFVI92203_09240 [Campylobacter fetus subsp. venerealis cfvi92/203]|uniref:hypothetical protein n=1 Tax=Campylobacter fetus TaxID=196 RepID=UPI000818C2F0|nr:hypothetical protein [Campylobacter fetus]OCS40114.1 hypothetical protein CFVI92203_09240 [Campylobacter fetus subsp. venerealis cfvi92/203]
MNLHIKVCRKLSLSRQELSDILGVSPTTLNSWSDDSRVSQTTRKALELMLENYELKEQLRKIKQGQEALNSIKI